MLSSTDGSSSAIRVTLLNFLQMCVYSIEISLRKKTAGLRCLDFNQFVALCFKIDKFIQLKQQKSTTTTTTTNISFGERADSTTREVIDLFKYKHILQVQVDYRNMSLRKYYAITSPDKISDRVLFCSYSNKSYGTVRYGTVRYGTVKSIISFVFLIVV